MFSLFCLTLLLNSRSSFFCDTLWSTLTPSPSRSVALCGQRSLLLLPVPSHSVVNAHSFSSFRLTLWSMLTPSPRSVPLSSSSGTHATATLCCRPCIRAGRSGRTSWPTRPSRRRGRTCSPAWPTSSTASPPRRRRWGSYRPRSSSHASARRTVRAHAATTRGLPFYWCCWLDVCVLWASVF